MDEMVTIASGNNLEMDLIKVYLESQGITVFLKGEFAGIITPHLVAPSGMGSVQVQVPAGQAKQARALIEKGK